MRLMKVIFIVCAVICVLGVGTIFADAGEELAPIFPGEDKFSSLEMKEFDQRSSPWSLATQSSVVASSSEYWSGKEPLRAVTVKRWVLMGAADVDWFVRTPTALSAPFPGWDSEANGVRISRLSGGGTALLSKDTTLVRISVNAAIDEVGADYMPDLIARIASHLSGGQAEIGLSVSVLSKHVMPHKGERVEIKVASDTNVDLQFDIYRVANRKLPRDLGDKVFSESVSGLTDFTFVWEGNSMAGKFVNNGNYDVEIKASSFGREETHVVSVQVNRQQGKQSWLKLGTRTLAYLGRPTPLGSVGYALLPGVHWLASLGGPAAGETVALEG